MNHISQTVPYQFDTPFSPFKASEFDRALEFLSGEGFTGVELAIAHPDEVDAGKLMDKLHGAGLAATSISTGQAYGLDNVFMGSSDKSVRNAAAKIITGHIALSKLIGGCPVTVGLIRGKLEPLPKRELLENLKEAMKPCIDKAGELGIMLQIEAICMEETSFINTTADCLEFMCELGDPACVSVLYDTYHSNREDGDMIKAINAARGRITDVHFADSHRGLPGYGDIDFKAVYEAIQATGYTGPYTLETLSIPSVEFVNANCFNSIKNIVK